MTNDGVRNRIAELRRPQTKAILSTRDHKRGLLMAIMCDEKQPMAHRLRALELDARLAGQFEADRTELEVGPKTLFSIRERALQVAGGLARRYGVQTQPDVQ
jgi:hypothetical protein